MSNLAEISTEPPRALPRRSTIIAKTILRALATLSRILRVAKEIRDVLKDMRDIMDRQRRLITSDEAERILDVSKTTLQTMRSSGALIDGIHFKQVNGTLRFPPNIGHLYITRALNISPNKDTEASTADTLADKQTANQHTKNVFKNKGK